MVARWSLYDCCVVIEWSLCGLHLSSIHELSYGSNRMVILELSLLQVVIYVVSVRALYGPDLTITSGIVRGVVRMWSLCGCIFSWVVIHVVAT